MLTKLHIRDTSRHRLGGEFKNLSNLALQQEIDFRRYPLDGKSQGFVDVHVVLG